MSKAFDAKEHALQAYPNDKESGVELFLQYIGLSEEDFVYEFSESSEEYIYGSSVKAM